MKRYRKKYISRKHKQKHMIFVMVEYFIFVIIICVLYLCYNSYETRKNQALYDNTPKKSIGSKNNFSTSSDENPDFDKLQSAQDENNEVVAWISIDNTNISYPVLQTDNNNYYLTHNYKKENSTYGSIFLHKNSSLTSEFSNLIIYGHNMKDGSQMFSPLLNYKDKSFFQEHKNIRITTKSSEYIYEIFSVFKSKVYENDDTKSFKYYAYTDLSTKEKFNDYISNCKKYQLYSTGVSAVYGNQIITLTTCEYSQANGRLVVVGKKVKTLSNIKK